MSNQTPINPDELSSMLPKHSVDLAFELHSRGIDVLSLVDNDNE